MIDTIYTAWFYFAAKCCLQKNDQIPFLSQVIRDTGYETFIKINSFATLGTVNKDSP